ELRDGASGDACPACLPGNVDLSGSGGGLRVVERRDDRGAEGPSVHYHAWNDGYISWNCFCNYGGAIDWGRAGFISEPHPLGDEKQAQPGAIVGDGGGGGG